MRHITNRRGSSTWTKLCALRCTRLSLAISWLSVAGCSILTPSVKVRASWCYFGRLQYHRLSLYYLTNINSPNHFRLSGRPVGSTSEHTYVCEYRVDRAARLFTKVSRARHQVCTKPYAFETFPQRIKHYRTYLVSFSNKKFFISKRFLNSKKFFLHSVYILLYIVYRIVNINKMFLNLIIYLNKCVSIQLIDDWSKQNQPKNI